MIYDNQIPIEFKDRLAFFFNLAKEQFSFLQNYNFSLDKEESGQTENFKDYFLELTFTNGDTVIKINFSTDIINGMKTAFPSLKKNELPVVDSQITCAVWDTNAFMSIDSYVETRFPEISGETFRIKLGVSDLKSEIARVTKSFSDFFKVNLILVLEKKVIYDCYTDRFYDKVFREVHYL
jgi:hypothetical protein